MCSPSGCARQIVLILTSAFILQTFLVLSHKGVLLINCSDSESEQSFGSIEHLSTPLLTHARELHLFHTLHTYITCHASLCDPLTMSFGKS